MLPALLGVDRAFGGEARLEPLQADEPGFAVPNIGRVLEIAAGIAQRLSAPSTEGAPA